MTYFLSGSSRFCDLHTVYPVPQKALSLICQLENNAAFTGVERLRRSLYISSELSMGCVDPWVGSGWVGSGSRIFVLVRWVGSWV